MAAPDDKLDFSNLGQYLDDKQEATPKSGAPASGSPAGGGKLDFSNLGQYLADDKPSTGRTLASTQIKQDEGLKLTPYKDTRGNWTVGYGHTGPDVAPGKSISQAQADDLHQQDLAKAEQGARDAVPNFDQLSPARQAVAINMAYQMGPAGVKGFEKAIAAVGKGDYATASDEMLKSDWAKQTPARAQRLSDQMRTGDVLGTDVAGTGGSFEAPTTPIGKVALKLGIQGTPTEAALASAGGSMTKAFLATQQLASKGLTKVGEMTGSKTLTGLGRAGQLSAQQGLESVDNATAPYAEAHPTASTVGSVAGLVGYPGNYVIPGGGAAATIPSVLARGAVTGAVLNTLTTPVEDNSSDTSFLAEKGKQALAGAAGGSAGALVAKGAAETVGGVAKWLSSTSVGKTVADAFTKGVNSVKNRLPGGANVAEAADTTVTKGLTEAGVNPAQVPADTLAHLKDQVADALQKGGTLDSQVVQRSLRAGSLPEPVPMLKGQLTRNAMDFAKEQNLRGVQGVGEPITEVLTSQNRALIKNLDHLGADKGANVVDAGEAAIGALQSADVKAKQIVSDAYGAFRAATGKDLDVPLHGVAQDYARVVEDFGDAIPSAVRRKFEGLGLLSGTQQKVFSINDAEGLIKTINANYDPSNRVAARALGELRTSVQNSIADGAGSSAQGAEAAFLAKSAREAAKLRFNQIENTPALKDAILGKEPDKFIQKHVLQGNVSQIKNLMDTLLAENPQAADALSDAVVAHIKRHVLNGATDENGIFSQAKLKAFTNDPNMAARLKEVLGTDRFATLKQLNSVAEDALYAPKASAVNTSNTASAAQNLKDATQGGVSHGLLTLAKNVPFIGGFANDAQSALQRSRLADLANRAANPGIGATRGVSTPLMDVVKAGAAIGARGAQRLRQNDADDSRAR